ncbi:8-oxo-dGTP diphosphatase [Herbiconiux sp. L3-i23]|uniref:8-oxo-dGTP diphosphatase n=1 Tax=Herbiconiux sp. L3-i23 TaxID=2905871 RepID=UPI00205473D0|nr:NUDIX domain-containing protein [Herbiconiux sp. L3-i23]BDI22453.1 hypothetical protein L3i23_12290 [Herbiconiux sp. L3-i23]
MFDVAVTYLLRHGARGTEVLLGEKLTGLGAGKIVGPGGKLEPGESAAQAAAREVEEEVGVLVRPDDLRRVARLAYEFPHRPAWSQRSTAFLAEVWTGEPRASSELAPRWYPIDALPLERMWDDARRWLPRVLTGERISVDCSYADDNDTVATWVEAPLD